jgi:PAS domain S-box-containing protein
MNLVTIIWSMVASACLTLAAMNLLVWFQKRTSWANLLLSMMAAGTAGIAFCELSMMLAATPAEFGNALWWGNIPVWMVVVSLVLFVRLYLRSGRVWLAWTIIGMRTLALILNFVLPPNLNYREITSLHHLRFLGESVAVARGVPNPWLLIAQVAVLLLVIFVVDAAVSVWRRQAQRRSLVLISGILLFLVASLLQSVLVFWGILSMPITFSFFSLGIVAVMAHEMSLDVQRAAQLSDDFRESEARLRDITFSMGDWVWEVDEKGVYTYSSAKGKELFGHVIGKTPFDLMPPEEADRVRPLFSELAAQKAPIKDLANWNVGKDGERICLLTNGVPILDEAGKLKGYRGVDKDITERKLAEAARLENMARYQAVVEAFDGFLYICSPDYRVEFMNQRLIERTGRNAVGEMCYRALHNSESVCEWCVNERVFQGETVRWEVQSPKDHRWYYVVNTPIRHADGTMSKQSMIMDITERKQAEEELQKSEERILALVENTSDFIWSVDAKTFGLLTFNAALRQYFTRGHGLEIHVGMTPDQMLPQEYAAQWCEFYARALREGPFVTEYLTSAKSHVLLLSINCLKIRGEVFGISVFGRDITERKQAEEILKANDAALRNSKKDLQRLAGRLISAQEEELRRLSRELHDDLTQRLAVLAIEAGKLELDLNKMPEKNLETVHTVAQIKDQLIKVSEDVHTISRQLHPTILDDLGLVRAIESESAAFMRRNVVEITFRKENVPDAIPDDIALCLYRVVQEGLKNIANHSGAKNCEIFLKGDDHVICLSVTDGGIGFDPLAVRNMPGLGLSSMRERVQLVQGDFTIRSQPGKGTVVNVCVPLHGRVR